ncbi:MAG TPA: hypothetical protein VG452_10185, partial [Egibacteraceae bacterium]|nr:hypothetical protein [Egibacteraceae bacterium]
MSRVKDLAGLAVLTIGATVAVVGLHRLGSLPWLQVPTDRLGTWLATTATADVVASVLRLIALCCAYWLLAGTALYTLARLSRVPAAISAVRWTTLPPVRRVVDRAVTLTLAVSAAVGGGAVAAADQATPP